MVIGQNDAHDHIVRGFSLNVFHTHKTIYWLVCACNIQQIGLIGSPHNNKRNQLYLLCHGKSPYTTVHTHTFHSIRKINLETFFLNFMKVQRLYVEVLQLHTHNVMTTIFNACDGLNDSLLALNCVSVYA